MDLRIAFDTVSHKILLQKLYHYGIWGCAHKIIESYLSFRSQFVSVHNHNSSLKLINIGVPQGSILGLLLFLIYVNDIPNTTLSRPCLFTDDTYLIVNSTSLSTLEQECNIELKKLQTWCNANKLEINPKKSASLLILSRINAPKVNLDIMHNDCPAVP